MRKIRILDPLINAPQDLIKEKILTAKYSDYESLMDSENGGIQIIYPRVFKQSEKVPMYYDAVVLFPVPMRQWEERKHVLEEEGWKEDMDQVSFYQALASKKYPNVPFVVVETFDLKVNNPDVITIRLNNRINEGDFAHIVIDAVDHHYKNKEEKENINNRKPGCNMM